MSSLEPQIQLRLSAELKAKLRQYAPGETRLNLVAKALLLDALVAPVQFCHLQCAGKAYCSETGNFRNVENLQARKELL